MNFSNKADYYAILQIDPSVGKCEIKAAYRRLALVWHPDKNNGSASAVVKFQEILEAYERLSDDDLRRQYDAVHLFNRPRYGCAQAPPKSKQDTDEMANEKIRIEKRDRQWEAEAIARVDAISRLKGVALAVDSAIRDLDLQEQLEEAEGVKSQGWFGNFFNWGVSAAQVAEEKMKRQRRYQHQRTVLRDRLLATKKSFWQAEKAHEELLAGQRKTRAEEARIKEERLREEKTKAQRERDAKPRNEAAERAAQQEAVRRRQQKAKEEEAATARKVARETAEKMAAQEAANRRREETERRERDLREELHKKLNLDSQAPPNDSSPRRSPPANVNASPASTSAPLHPNQQHTGRATTQPRKQQNSGSKPKSEAARKACSHRQFWPKVQGRYECSVCLETFPSFILQCPQCQIMACASCRRQIRGGGL